MPFSKEELEAIAKRAPAQKGALDKFWNSLSKEEQRIWLANIEKEKQRRDQLRAYVYAPLIFLYILFGIFVGVALLFK